MPEPHPFGPPNKPVVCLKLGRKCVKTDSRTLCLGKYFTGALPAPPATADWTKGIADWGMMLNDQLGDCTIVGCAHGIQDWTANDGTLLTLPDSVVEDYYRRWCGYDGTPETDLGGIELDVLKSWRKEGLANHTLTAFADAHSVLEARQGIHLFGGVYIGVALPNTAQNQDMWDVVPNGGADAREGSWGGHAVFVPKYDADGFTCITWGQQKTMTLAFWKKYVDEVHVLLGADWTGPDGKAPSGFDSAQLQADLAEVTR